MNKYAFATYILIFFLGADAIYIFYMPSVILPLVWAIIISVLIVMVVKPILFERYSVAANKKIVEKYGPIIMKYMEDLRNECMECGATLDKNARYCNKCGKKVK